MSSVGTTTIVATGDPAQREALHLLAFGTRCEPKLLFTIDGLLGGPVRDDGHCCWTSLVCDVDHVTLAASLDYNWDCLGLASVLSGRFRELTFHSWFQREDEVEQALAVGHRSGAEIYRVMFDGPATYFKDASLLWGGRLVRYHQRSPAADMAAEHHADRSGLSRLASQAAGPTGWHAVQQDAYPSLFYRTSDENGPGTVILVDNDEILLLEDVNMLGGYRHSQVLTIAVLRDLHPEVCRDVQAAQEHRRDLARRSAQARIHAPCGDPADEELAF